MRRPMLALVAALAMLAVAGVSRAKDLGDILVQKGLITPEELRQAREEDKQKSAAEESRRDAIVIRDQPTAPWWVARGTSSWATRRRCTSTSTSRIPGLRSPSASPPAALPSPARCPNLVFEQCLR